MEDAAGKRDALEAKEKGLASTLEEQQAKRDDLVARKDGVDRRLGQAQDSLDNLNAKHASLDTRLKILSMANDNLMYDFRFMVDPDLRELTGDDEAAFEYLRGTEFLDDDGVAKAAEELSGELDQTSELEDNAAREVETLTAESESLGTEIVAADEEIFATEDELAETKDALADAQAELDEKLADGAAKKASFCTTWKKTCMLPLHIVVGAGVYTLVCEEVDKLIMGRSRCLWSKPKPTTDNTDTLSPSPTK